MVSIFARRLRCFYCGKRSAPTEAPPIRKWRCKYCEATNYLDENGEITDPPPEETNPDVYGEGAREQPFETIDFAGSGIFCATCVRNQRLFTSALASYFPPPDDPDYGAYELEFPKFRSNMEERYPQVCEKCEPRVNERIGETIYKAKTDFLGRMLARSKAAREARRARRMNWRNWLVSVGACAYWVSIAGQLAWDVMAAVAAGKPLHALDYRFSVTSLRSLLHCGSEAYKIGAVPDRCAIDLAPYAGLSLVMGILSLWWNPMLRFLVEGQRGKLAGLGEYYRFQLIVMVTRCVFWALLKDAASSGLRRNLPSALHLFMILFTFLSVTMSRRIVRFDTRPLVDWRAWSPSMSRRSSTDQPQLEPNANCQRQSAEWPRIRPSKQKSFSSWEPELDWPSMAQVPWGGRRPSATAGGRCPRETSLETRHTNIQRLLSGGEDADEMEWTPTRPQIELRPNVSVRPMEERSVLDEPLPFYGQLPPAPRPPAWTLRTSSSIQKAAEAVVEPNPFHRPTSQLASTWQPSTKRSEVVFAPPKFFPKSDHEACTGLENLFDRTFSIKSPGEEDDAFWRSASSSVEVRQTTVSGLSLTCQWVRVFLLFSSIGAWLLVQYQLLSLPGNYVEVLSLGSVGLIAGFALLDTLNRPISQWDGKWMLLYVAELAAAVHLGGHLPQVSFIREYFDRYGKLLLVFLTLQETLVLWLLRRRATQATASSPEMGHRVFGSAVRDSASPRPPSQPSEVTVHSHPPRAFAHPPTLSGPFGDSEFASAMPPRQQSQTRSAFGARSGVVASTQAPVQHQPAFAQPSLSSYESAGHGGRPASAFSDHPHSVGAMHAQRLSSHNLNLNHHLSDESESLRDDSDSETTATAATSATTATNHTLKNIRLGRDPSWRSPASHAKARERAVTGSLFSGLTLDELPTHRVTRSQARLRRGY